MNTETLAGVSLFAGLEQEQLQRLAAIAASREYGRGDAIFQEGDPAHGLYAVLQGRVRVYKSSPAGKEQILHVFGAGEPFGEAALFMGCTFPAHAQALEPSRVLFIPRDELRTLLAQDPDLAFSMLGLLSARLRGFVHKVEELSLKEVPARLAQHLLLLSAAQQSEIVTLELPKSQLAALLGTIPETLSRVLKKLGEEDALLVEGKRIILLDRGRLQAVASGLEMMR